MQGLRLTSGTRAGKERPSSGVVVTTAAASIPAWGQRNTAKRPFSHASIADILFPTYLRPFPSLHSFTISSDISPNGCSFCFGEEWSRRVVSSGVARTDRNYSKNPKCFNAGFMLGARSFSSRRSMGNQAHSRTSEPAVISPFRLAR